MEKEKKEMNIDTPKLMTYEEYEKLEHPTPYTFVVKKDNGAVYYFGEKHSFDPKNPQWDKEKEFWNEFLKETDGKKRIVFTEGGIRPLEKTEEEAIFKWGGMGLATFLAGQNGIEIYSPEPNEKEERDMILSEFSPEEVEYYYFARIVYQWGNMEEPKPDFSTYVSNFLKGDKHISKWEDFDFSLENMKKIHHSLFGTDFNENDTDFFYSIVNPVELNTVVNKVARASSIYRDEHIIGEIKSYQEQGYSIFIQYGSSHAVMQEPALK